MTTPQKLTAQDLFETTECGRCGGSGHYSFNTMHGTRCYGCGGRGWKYTKRGLAARDAWVEAYTRSVRVADLQPGQQIMVDDAMRGRWVRLTVETSGPDELNPGRWTVKFAPGQSLGGYGFLSGDEEVRFPSTSEEKRVAYEAIRHMPGAIYTGAWPQS